MVTEGPGGEETSVYDITLSEIHATMWFSFFGFESLKIWSFLDVNPETFLDSSAIWREYLVSILLFCYWLLHNRCSYIKVPYREKFYIILFWCLYSKIIDIRSWCQKLFSYFYIWILKYHYKEAFSWYLKVQCIRKYNQNVPMMILVMLYTKVCFIRNNSDIVVALNYWQMYKSFWIDLLQIFI